MTTPIRGERGLRRQPSTRAAVLGLAFTVAVLAVGLANAFGVIA